MTIQSENYQQQLHYPYASPNNEFGYVYSPTCTDSSSMPASFTNVISTKLTSDDTNSNTITKSSDREVVLFPTYAMRKKDDPSQWIVQTKGWALSHNVSVAKQKVAMGVTKNIAGKTSADRPSSDRFEQRFKYFLAKNKGNKKFVIHADGATSIEQRMQDVSNDEKHQQDEYSTTAYTIDNNSSNDMDADMIADKNAAAIEPFFIPQQSTNSKARRSSAASTDSGFQSSPADDDNEKKLDDDFYYYEQPLQNINTTAPPLLIDPLLALRPGNPLSTVLDGGRRPYSASTTSFRSQSDSSTSGSGLSSPSSNTTFATFTSNSNDEFYSNNNQLTVDSIESSSSSSTASSSMNETTTIAATTITSIYNTEIKTENTGFMNGEIIIPDSQVQLWAKEHDQCTTRIIRLRSQAETFKPSFGHVSLVEPKGISIISDIDDTIKDTQILAGPRTVLSNTFFKQSRDVPGMADAYMHWYTQGAAFHYVSNSPFQLMPMLDQFLKSSAFPPGSMHLRVDGKLLARLIEVPGRAKRDAILQIIKDFPHRQFVLIGDSGEIDLEIYAHIAAEYRNRILKIFIRDVSSNKKKDELQQQQQQLGRRTTISAMTSLFTPNTSKNNNNKQRPPNSINSNDASSRRAATLGDMASIPSVSLQSRVAKAKQLCSVDIVIFQDAETLRNDSIIRDALWNSLDEQS